jgi:beta-lactamase regulating signal transducer with metallopeptidase domain
MIHLPLWLLPGITNDLGWTLIHFLWQGLVLAAILQAILPMCRDAAARHNWALAMLAMMVLAPVLTFLFIHGHQSAGASLVMVFANTISGIHGDGATMLQAAIPFNWINLLVAFWLAGIVVLALRAIGGWYLVELLWRRDAFAVPDDLLQRCRALQARFALTRPIVFLQSCRVNTPVVIGWFRPIVLIPISAISGLLPHQLDTLIMHELAHIRRFDALTNIMLIMAETVLFYHPAIWWVCRRVRIEREHCCDDFAVSMCGDATLYVEALTSLKISKAMPVLVLAAGNSRLKERVARLLDVPSNSRKISPSAMIGLLFICAVAASATMARNSKDGSTETVAQHPHIAAATAAQKKVPNAYSIHAIDSAAQVDGRYRRQIAGAQRRNVATNEVFQLEQSASAPDNSLQTQAGAALPTIDSQDSRPPAASINVAEAVSAQVDAAGTVERIVVTAKKWLGDEPLTAIHNFVNSYTNPATLTVGEIARWKGAICVRTYGLSRAEYDDFVTTRVENIAVGAGLEIKSAPCHFGVEIIFTAKPQEFLDKVREINASLLGPKPSQSQANSMRYPVQAWYATGTRDIHGQPVLDDEENAGFGNTFGSLPGLSTVPIYAVEGSHFRTGLNSEMAHIYIVADTSKTEGYRLGAVADYVAVLALSQTQNFDACRPMPSITNLISPVCGVDLKSAAITDTDLAYLKAVYTMDPGANFQQQRNFIADRIAMALGVR